MTDYIKGLVERARAECSCDIDNNPCMAEDLCRLDLDMADALERLMLERDEAYHRGWNVRRRLRRTHKLETRFTRKHAETQPPLSAQRRTNHNPRCRKNNSIFIPDNGIFY